MKAHRKDDGLKTLTQWQKEGMTIKEGCEGVELWNNCLYRYVDTFYSADEVRAMTSEEKKIFDEERKAKQRQQRQERKQRQEEEEKRYKRLCEIRETIKTEWQWLQLYKKVKIGSLAHLGSWYNEKYFNRKSWCGSNYWYYAESQVEDITTPEDYVKEMTESYENYHKEAPSDELKTQWQKNFLNRETQPQQEEGN